MKLLIFLLLPSLTYAIDVYWRKVKCDVYLQRVFQDKTIFYLYPGKSVTSRMSINRGEDEVFLTIDHNMISSSKISVKDYFYGPKATPDIRIKVSKEFRMKDLEKGELEIQVPTKNSSRTATIRCSLLQK